MFKLRFKNKGFRKLPGDSGSIREIERMIRKDPGNPRWYVERGDHKLKNHCYVDAIIDYNKAIRLNCRFMEAYHRRAKAKERMSYYQGALADYEYILANDPEDAMASRGRNLLLGRFE